MEKIILKALEMLVDDGGIDCLKDALKKAIKDINPGYEIHNRDWDYMFTELVLRSKK